MNHNYKLSNNQILIGVSPNPTEIFTNSRIKLYCTKNNNIVTPTSFNVEWKRIAIGLEQPILVHQNSAYECSSMDLGYFIEARIKIEDQGIATQQTRKFGPIKLQFQLANLVQKSVTAQSFRVKISLQKITMDLAIKLNQVGITFVSKQNFQCCMKVDSLADIKVKLDTKAVTLKLNQYNQTIVKYISVLVKHPLKIKIEQLDIMFENRFKRDYFILMMKKLLYRKTITISGSHLQREESYIKGREAYLSNNHHFITRPRVSSEPQQLSKSRKKVEKKFSKNQRVQQNQIIKDLESKNIFFDFAQKKQDALNLRDSFNQMQQQYLKEKKQSFKELSLDQIKFKLEEAKKQIQKLTEENQALKDENIKLKQSLSNAQNTNVGRELVNLRQRIQYLLIQNQRLQIQRTQIIADKISVQIKYQKQKGEKESLKQKLIPLSMLPKFQSPPKKIQFKNLNVTKSLHPLISGNSQITKQLTNNDYSKSMKDLKPTTSDISPENRKRTLKPKPVFKRLESSNKVQKD